MKKANINWTAKALCNQMDKGRVNFDNAIQRSLVWDLEKKSLLIHSMVYEYAIPALYFTKDEDGYDSLDGKQRSNTIHEYINDEFTLMDNTPLVYDDDGNSYDMSGKVFSKLPEWVQDKIKDYNLTIYYYEGMNEDEVKEFFRRLNNGKPLTAIELTRVNAPCLKDFQDLAKHPAIQSIVSKKGKERFTDETIAMQLYHFITEKAPDFSTKQFRTWVRNTTVDESIIHDIKHGLDKYLIFIGEIEEKGLLKKFKTRTHFISIAYYCYLSYLGGVPAQRLKEAIVKFFRGTPTICEEYNKTITSGSAKPGAVLARKNAIIDLFNNRDNSDDVHDETHDEIDVHEDNNPDDTHESNDDNNNENKEEVTEQVTETTENSSEEDENNENENGGDMETEIISSLE